jgi:hypothetical protein
MSPSFTSLEAAQQLLRQFTNALGASAVSSTDYPAIREALQAVAARSDYQIFGLCADNLVQGIASLEQYLVALGYEAPVVVWGDRPGTVYLKYNPNTQRHWVDGYVGSHRGVLVSCQSAYDDDINETFGHLPLDLFQV